MKLKRDWLNPKLKISFSKINGMGLFTNEDINKNELLVIFGGDLMYNGELQEIPKYLQEYNLQINEHVVLSGRDIIYPSESDYINHSCNPNSGFKGQIFLVAMRNIKKDEEITFDYAMVVSECIGANIVFKLNCNCNSDNCRKLITENDWKLPEIQKKYNGYFSQYLQDKINHEHID